VRAAYIYLLIENSIKTLTLSRQIVLKLLRLCVAGVILFYLFEKVPISDVIDVLKKCQISDLALAFVFLVLVHLTFGYRLKQLIKFQGLNFSTFKVFKVNLIAAFYSLFIPGGSFIGIIIRVYKLSDSRKDIAGIGLSVILDRIIATLTLCAIGALLWMIENPNCSELILFLMLGVLAILTIITAMAFCEITLPKISFLGNRIERLIGQKLDTLKKAVHNAHITPKKLLIGNLMLSFAAQLLGVFCYYLLATSLNLNLSLVSVGWVRSAVILIAMIPISISGIGLREGAMIVLLQQYGLTGDQAIAYSLLIFTTTILAPGISGGILEALRQLR
jgi:uncharacterized protein (TIRG00374 family)